MMRLEIIGKNSYLYNLKDPLGNIYEVNMEFFDLEEPVNIGDKIYLNEELLNSKYDGYSTSYTFGNLENKYGKENIQLDDIDVIKLIIDEKEIYLKRLYG